MKKPIGCQPQAPGEPPGGPGGPGGPVPFEANDGLWNLITYCAATGGSLLVIGSAAGVAFMGALVPPGGAGDLLRC